MKYDITKDYLPIRKGKTGRRGGKKMDKCVFTVAHDTGNPNSAAENNVNYYKDTANEQSASAHIFVDDKKIIECVPLLTSDIPEKAFHVMYDKPTDNRIYGDDAIDIAAGVEYCYGNNINSDEAYKRYVWVLAYIAYKFNQNPLVDLVGHMILDPQRRTDPENGLSQSGRSYKQLILDVYSEYLDCIGDYGNIKLESGRVVNGIKIENDYLIPLSDIEDILKPISIISNNRKSNIQEEDSFMVISLHKNNKGFKVKELQEKLIQLGYDLGKWGADGSFGRGTENAVKQFQENNNLIIDGSVGKNTWFKIEELLKNKTTNSTSYVKTYEVGSTEIIECSPDRINILEVNKPLKNYIGGSGTFSWTNNSNGILINNGKIINQYSSHAWIGLPDGVLCYYTDGSVGIETVIDATKISKPVIWAISGITLQGETETEFRNYSAKQGFKIFYKDGKKYNHTDVFRNTNHNSIGYKLEDGIYKIFYYRKSNCSRFRTVQSAKNLALDGAIGLDSGHISAMNINNFKVNINQKQNNIVQIKI